MEIGVGFSNGERFLEPGNKMGFVKMCRRDRVPKSRLFIYQGHSDVRPTSRDGHVGHSTRLATLHAILADLHVVLSTSTSLSCQTGN